jgi:hypothetical protein
MSRRVAEFSFLSCSSFESVGISNRSLRVNLKKKTPRTVIEISGISYLDYILQGWISYI